MRYTVEDSVVIARPARDVYGIVSDITRTGEWSEQCHTCTWDGVQRGVGATFTGHNRTAVREWSTTSTVTVDDPARQFEWAVSNSETRWGFRIDALDEDTARLVEYTDFGDTGEAFFRTRYGDDAAEQMVIRVTAAMTGIPATLARIKAIAES
ncbi:MULTISPECIES: SRPBCC family protein [unclassified Gordonia (in: high G+C Gram-positive bacteria)]